MDTILKEKIKIVYDNWIDFGNAKDPLPNGLHPIVLESIKNKFKETHNLHQCIMDVNQTIEGNTFPFDHSNFWGYTVHQLPFIDISEIDVNSDNVYVWPLEIKGSVHLVFSELNIKHNNQSIKYYLHDVIKPETLALMRSGKLKLVINMAQDPMDYEVLFKVEKYFNDVAKIDPSNVIFITGNDVREEYKQAYSTKKLKISPAPLLIAQQTARTMTGYPRVTSLGYTSDIVREEDLDKSKIRPSKFLSLNRTMKPHRYVLAYHALKNNLLKDNIYSFLNSFGAKEESIVNCITRFFPKSNEIHEYSRQIEKLIPYEIDTNGLSEPERCSMTSDNNKKEVYANTYVNIVSETGFIEGKKPFISEKIWKPVINLQPFILVGNYHTLRYIRELGFKTFSPFIDESYDEVFDHKERMRMVLAEIDKLSAMPIEKIHEWYYSITDILIYNREHLKTFSDLNPYQVVVEDIINTYKG